MKNYFSLISLLALLAVGCNQENIWEKQAISDEGRIFTTSFESDESRTYIENGYLSRWTEDDRISLFDGNTLNRQYKFDGKTGDNSGTFSIVEKPFGTGAILSANYAIYPYNSETKITENGVISTTLPALQYYAVNSYGLEANTMVAVTHNIHDTFLKFKNACGCLKIQLFGDDVTIKSITLTGNNHEKLAGTTNITAEYGESPTIFTTNDATEHITLNCGEGIKIGQTAETSTAFWIVVPPTTFEKGITIKVKETNGKVFTQTTTKELAIRRNVVQPMTTFEVKGEIPYITFTASEKQTLQMSKAIATLEYSVGDGEWKTLGTNTITFGSTNGNIRLRGKSTNGTGSNYSNYSRFVFGNSGIPVSCKGDIRTLLDYQNYETVNTKNARFYQLFSYCNLTSAPELPITDLATDCYKYMFSNCKNLVTAPTLPATILTENCYSYMFYYCEDLVNAPELPSTTLAESCYSGMFMGCKSLVKAPELPATTLTKNCYRYMFYVCTNLTSAPELPATTLAENCYSWMFNNCTSLITAPKLPARTLAEYCFYGMFQDCVNLLNAPELPAKTLTKNCYMYMFNNCKKLNSITMLATDISASNCLYDWVNGVAGTGTFIKSEKMESLPTGYSGIPKNWTVKNYAKE